MMHKLNPVTLIDVAIQEVKKAQTSEYHSGITLSPEKRRAANKKFYQLRQSLKILINVSNYLELGSSSSVMVYEHQNRMYQDFDEMYVAYQGS